MSIIYETKRNENLVSLAEDGDTILGILRDNDESNDPRGWDDLGKMVCYHKNYDLGDKHEFKTPEEFKEFIKKEKNCVYLPVYLLDHSGITISTTSFNDRWDSGKVGWIYATEETIKKDQNVEEVTDEVIKKVKDIFRGEVEVYDQYLTGGVYGFSLENRNGDIIDSCGGFFGSNFEENGIKDALDDNAHLIDKLKDVN